MEEYLFKILVVGEASTGKTSFIRRYVHQFFSRHYQATIGVDFALKTLQYDENTLIRLQIWDIAGQERFSGMTRAYYRDAVGALVMFDASNMKTFESVRKWKSDLDKKVSLSDGQEIPCLLLANKCDLIKYDEKEDELLKNFAKDFNFIGHMYTSPMNNTNIETAVKVLVQEIMRRRRNIDQNDFARDDVIILRDEFNSRSNRNKDDSWWCFC